VNRFENAIAVVTGGVSGIGAAITRRLIEEGARVVVADINAEAIDRVPETFGDAALGVVTDATSEPDMERLFATAAERFGGIDAVFNVAGGARHGRILDMDLAQWEFNLRLNLSSAFLGTRLGAKQFVAQGRPGTIVNIASLMGTVPQPAGSAYASAKAGVVMLTRTAAVEFARRGIRVNAVSPGLVSTPLVGVLTDNERTRQAFLDRIPAQRPAEPEEIAGVALFLASPDAAYVNGENVIVDGGWQNTGYPDLRGLL
jgi:meso-butanediol dehydrogenase / (S,S)-butanediol dehydrogenase / diacetyl reductase